MCLNRIYRLFSEKRFLWLAIACIFCSFFEIFTEWKYISREPEQYLFLLAVIIVVAVTFLFLFKNIKFDERAIIFLIFAVAFIFRLVYIQTTDHLVRQHDVGGSNGHMAYIMTFYNHKELPDTINWQYYQPPVWHYICALFLHIQTTLGIALDVAKENLQLLSLFCSSAIMLVSHSIFRKFNLKGLPMIIACVIVAFHPTFIILSGSINNDVLSLLLALVSVNLAIKWYREPNLKTILLLALSIGFSMGVKLSGGLISVGVAMLFAIRLFGKQYKNKLSLIGQFASFGVICFPIALWWQIKNLIVHGTPITYVPMLSKTNSQYIGFRSITERLFDISSIWDVGVYPARAIESKAEYFDYYEFNIPAAALKTSVFGEYYIGFSSDFGRFFANVLFYSAAILAVLTVVSAVYLVIKSFKNSTENYGYSKSELIFTLVCALTIIFSYVKFCFDFAHFCTMDFRYIAMTVIFGALYIGLLLKHRQKNNKIFDSVLRIGIIIFTVLMAISSVAIYGTIA
ncbi:MAG: phospholipid carrier-dependent glycosyltransferase [Clostridia bacterium]|nr:phospholipid carrier-dependent glycosyltransferase [Clostridia bacterium]